MESGSVDGEEDERKREFVTAASFFACASSLFLRNLLSLATNDSGGRRTAKKEGLEALPGPHSRPGRCALFDRRRRLFFFAATAEKTG